MNRPLLELVEHLQAIQRTELAKPSPARWLPQDPSAAFVCCIGAGPWKFARRKAVQSRALDWLGGWDLADVDPAVIVNWYPLTWQNRYVQAVALHLHNRHLTMAACCEYLRSSFATVDDLYYICGVKYSKTLSLFARDYLQIPSFPIDRHVARTLKDGGFPVDEVSMLALCDAANVNPIVVARQMISGKLDVGNPDFSDYQYKESHDPDQAAVPR